MPNDIPIDPMGENRPQPVTPEDLESFRPTDRLGGAIDVDAVLSSLGEGGMSIREAILGADWELTDNEKAARLFVDEIINSLNASFEKRELCIEAVKKGRPLFGVEPSIIELHETNKARRGKKKSLMSINATNEDIILDFYDGSNPTIVSSTIEANKLIIEFLSNKNSGAHTLRSFSAMVGKVVKLKG